LDGIPLAIELAAARTRALSVEQIARMLDDRFRLLTGGSRSVLERHRTLRATVQWSYDHLDDEEQALFVELSVFAGGWTLDGATKVTGGDAFEVLDRLTRLIDKSLVARERHGEGEARYRMLETLRQFGLEVLASSGRADALRAAHLGFYLGMVQAMEGELREAFPIVALGRLESDVDNLRAALTWGFQHDPPRAVELTRRLERLWSSPGYYAEGRRWYARTLALGDRVAPEDRAAALARAGRLAFQQGDYDEALRLYEEGLAIRRALGDRRRIARGLVLCANIRAYRGEHDAARVLFEEALALYADLDDRAGMGRLETAIGLGAYLEGRFEEARRRFAASLEVFRPLGDLNRIQVALGNLSLVDLAEGDASAAGAHLRECLSINRQLRNLYGISHFLPALAETFRLEGDAATAARVIGATDALLDRIGAALEALERSVYDQTVTALRAELGEEAFTSAQRDGRAMTWEDAITLAGA
jgi:non-specific serine/threonine protein kinase